MGTDPRQGGRTPVSPHRPAPPSFTPPCPAVHPTGGAALFHGPPVPIHLSIIHIRPDAPAAHLAAKRDSGQPPLPNPGIRNFSARKFGLYYKLLYICSNITTFSTSQTRKNHGKDRPQDRPPTSVQAQFSAPVLHIPRNVPLSDRGKLLHLAGLLVGSVGRTGMGLQLLLLVVRRLLDCDEEHDYR